MSKLRLVYLHLIRLLSTIDISIMVNSNQPLLYLDKVSKIYNLGGHSVKALDKVSLKIWPGEFISVVGPSGSGKSTLLQIMGLLDKHTSGKLYFLNKETSHYSAEELAALRNHYIGFVFQRFNLLPKTSALDNVLLPATYNQDISLTKARKTAISLLKSLGLGKRIYNHPNQLSGGQQQRVAIARALINDPKIIFADEPTGNLDSKSGQEVIEILRKLHAEGRTIVLVTHDLDLAKIAQRTIHILDGKIIGQETNL